MPKTTLTFLVGSFNNPAETLLTLASLNLQQINNEMVLRITVVDNSDNVVAAKNIADIADNFNYDYIKGNDPKSCYNVVSEVAKQTETDWICFASADCYYVPAFSFLMLEAARRYDADFVYCDGLFDPRLHGRGIYSVLNVFPEIRFIDKAGFIIKKRIFSGFPSHPQDWRDGQLVEDLVKQGVKMAKAKGVLWVHN
jgi:hypothetical protein